MRQMNESDLWKVVMAIGLAIVMVIILIRMVTTVCSNREILNVAPVDVQYRATDHWERRRDAQLEIAKDASHSGTKKKWQDHC